MTTPAPDPVEVFGFPEPPETIEASEEIKLTSTSNKYNTIKLGGTAKGLTWRSLDSEAWREYQFKDGRVLRISEPRWLAVTERGHRVLDRDSISYYIFLEGVAYIRWGISYGEPNFTA